MAKGERAKKSASAQNLAELFRPANPFQKGIRRRWMINSVGVVLSVVIVVIIISAVSLSNYYYNSMRLGMEAKVNAASEFFSSYASNENEYLDMANYYVNEFDERDRLELQFIDIRRQRVVLSSMSTYGLNDLSREMTPDVTSTIESMDTDHWVGRDPDTGERIMAVACPIINRGEVKAVMRLVTSLSVVDRQIIQVVLLIMLGGFLLVLLMYAAI